MSRKFLNPQHYGAPRRPVHFHIRLAPGKVGPVGDVLLAQPDHSDSPYALVAVCHQHENALAVVSQLRDSLAAGTERALLAVAESAVEGWSEMLGVALGCQARRIRWAAVDRSGDGFIAVAPRGGEQRNWIPLRDVGVAHEANWARFRSVFPEYGGLAMLKVTQLITPAGLDA